MRRATTGVDSHARVIREFIEYARTRGSPGTVCTDDIKSLSTMLGAIEGSERGTRFRSSRGE